MIKAAFCDDDDTVLKELQSLLEEYRRERDYRIDAKVYHSPLDLLKWKKEPALTFCFWIF